MLDLLKRLGRDERGVSAVEFALLLPVMLALLLGSVTVFDLFRTEQSAEKATFTVGDMMSRTKTSISQNDLKLMVAFIDNTVEHQGDARLRVSSISNINGQLKVDWSRSEGNTAVAMGNVSLDGIPQMAAGDSVILTEAFVPHRAFVPVAGLDHIVYHNRAVHRPRFVGRIAFQ